MSKNSYKAANILLIEDDDVDAKGVERALNKLRIKNPLFRAKDGIEALDLLGRHDISKPFLILLDLNLPRMNGHEFLDRLRNDQKYSDTVVFVLTTSKADEDKNAAYDKHVAGYIVKDKMDSGFESLVGLLDHYWRIVELPVR